MCIDILIFKKVVRSIVIARINDSTTFMTTNKYKYRNKN